MGPLVFLESRNAPKHAERLDSPSRDDGSTIKRFPSKLLDYLRHFGFCFRIVSANEHSWEALFVLRIDHSRGTDAVKGLYHVCTWSLLLNFFGQRFVGTGSELQYPVDRRSI